MQLRGALHARDPSAAEELVAAITNRSLATRRRRFGLREADFRCAVLQRGQMRSGTRMGGAQSDGYVAGAPRFRAAVNKMPIPEDDSVTQ